MVKVLVKPVDPNADPALEEPLALASRIVSVLSTPKARDKQVQIGPSGVGNPCEVCLAAEMAHLLPGAPLRKPNKLSLASWMGSAVHAYLEALFNTPEMRERFPGWVAEQKLYCGDIPGYGPITGSADGYDPISATVLDWKIVGANSFQRMKMYGVDVKYDYQRHVYGRGIELLGLPIKYVLNFIFLAGSTAPDFRHILPSADHYRPEMSEIAFARAGRIYQEYVLPGRQHELESDPDCYQCLGIADLFF